jgi:hypothetical protein
VTTAKRFRQLFQALVMVSADHSRAGNTTSHPTNWIRVARNLSARGIGLWVWRPGAQFNRY